MIVAPRWTAVAEYRSAVGIVDVTHEVEELFELHDLIERGPDWRSIEKITITLNRRVHGFDHLTIERAAEL